ncbi:unnamed protein product [Cyclocybe aegerita]|uniref:Uncharacterized protein n=1 Tax=Cyclocybe aegerita TaxID=1973307 RepID=A0A8S0WBA2_CYCAE|nr:unnamed protein product [Cyclocybe aegerita]
MAPAKSTRTLTSKALAKPKEGTRAPVKSTEGTKVDKTSNMPAKSSEGTKAARKISNAPAKSTEGVKAMKMSNPPGKSTKGAKATRKISDAPAKSAEGVKAAKTSSIALSSEILDLTSLSECESDSGDSDCDLTVTYQSFGQPVKCHKTSHP